MGRSELENKLAVLLGGRAAESICFPEVSTGAADDLKKATDIARSIVTRFGMDETLGNVSYEDEPSPFLGALPGISPPTTRYSEDTTRKIDEAGLDRPWRQSLRNAPATNFRKVLNDRRSGSFSKTLFFDQGGARLFLSLCCNGNSPPAGRMVDSCSA